MSCRVCGGPVRNVLLDQDRCIECGRPSFATPPAQLEKDVPVRKPSQQGRKSLRGMTAEEAQRQAAVKQTRILQAIQCMKSASLLEIVDFFTKNGQPPIPYSTMRSHLTRLRQDGLIEFRGARWYPVCRGCNALDTNAQVPHTCVDL